MEPRTLTSASAHQQLMIAGLAVGVVVACAGATPGGGDRPGSAATSEPNAASSQPAAPAGAAFPYLNFEPDSKPKPEVAAVDAGTDSAASVSPPKAYPQAPTCKAVPTTAPLSVDGSHTLVDSPNDPRLVTLRKYVARLSRREVQCSVGHNDGRLFSLECASFYVNADGNPRPGGVEGQLFEWNGRRFELLPPKQLFPGAKSHAALLKEVCNADEVGRFTKVWLDHQGMSFVAGLSPMDQAPCRVEYAEHADWVGCGPLAYLAGYAPRAVAPPQALPEPLGWDSGRVMSRLPGQQALVQQINAKLDAFRAAVPEASESGCEPVLTTNQVISLQCTKDYDTALSLNYSVRTGAEIDIDALMAVAGPRLAKAVSKDCNEKYFKRPKSSGDLALKAPVDLQKRELASFHIRASSIEFRVELELQSGGDATAKRPVTCRASFAATGLSLAKLGAAPPIRH